MSAPQNAHRPAGRRVWLGLALAAVLLAVLVFSLLQSKRERPAYTATYWDVFDTVVMVTGYADSEEAWNAQAEALHADLQRYNQLFDIYNAYPGVENLYTVNQNAGKSPVKVDPAILQLVELGKQMYTETNGACNIAGGAVLTLWHDARTAGLNDPGHAALPDAAALAGAGAHVDIEKVVTDDAASTLYLSDAAMSLDVGSIAKGWATEAAAQAAEARGLKSALISAGGNLRAIGAKPDGTAWTAGVDNPWPDSEGNYSGEPVARIALQSGESLVVSGDYQRYYTVDGKKYSHLIDPATLYPAVYMNEVAVLCQNSGIADALSTGLFCMSVADGQALVSSLPGVEAVWMTADRAVAMSAGFEAHAAK